MPCLNEATTIGNAIRLAQEAIALTGLRGEIVISDNGSSDDSISIAESAGARVVRCPNKGYGNALMTGLSAARGAYLVMGDADATYDFRDAVPMVKELQQGCDLVMGSRLRGRISPEAMPPLHRYLGTPVLTAMIRLFFGIQISDCNCGLRAFTRVTFDRLRLVSGGMEFASEMIVKAARLKLKVKEIPCSLAAGQKGRKPHLNTWRDGWRHMRFIMLFAPHILFRAPAWFFLGVGLAISLPVLAGPLDIMGRTLDYHLLFYGMPMIHLGYQTLWFEALERRFVRFAGLLPDDDATVAPRAIEPWLVAGGLLGVSGFVCLIWMGALWLQSGMGPLQQPRLGAVGMFLLIAGIQTVLNALLAGMLDLKMQKTPTTTV